MKQVQMALFLFAFIFEPHEIALGQARPDSPLDFVGALMSRLMPFVLMIIVVYFLIKIHKKWFRSSKLKSSNKNIASQTAISTPRSQGRSTGGVFISYRREDSADITGRIYDRLVQHFSKEIVFKDVDSIPLGIDFRRHIEGALGQCKVLVAVIGENWIENNLPQGQRRINNPRDHLRIEVEVALRRDIPVIPVLVRRATMPSEDQLPPSLQSLAYRNGIPIRPDPDFHTDMDRLIKGIEVYL